MKILVVQDYLRSGGTERQACTLASAFADSGHQVMLMTFRPGGALSSLPSARVQRLVLQKSDLGWDWYAPGLIRRAREFDPDGVLCMGRMANCYGSFLAGRLQRAVVIATLRTGKVLPWLFRRSLRTVRHVVANSHETRDRVIAAGQATADRVSVIHNSLVFTPAPPPSDQDREEARRQRGAGPDTVVLLWVGMFRPEKNHRECLDLVARLPASLPWQFWLVGEGPTRAELMRQTASRGLADRVQFLGFMSNPTSLYPLADLAVMTSRSESLSNFLIEAHAHGLPSLAYAASGVSECGGTVVPMGDQTAFLAALEKRVADREFRRQESCRVRQFARDAFSPDKQTRAYLDLFQKLHAPST